MHGDPLYHCSLVISNLYLEIRSLSFKISRDMINIASGHVPHFLPVNLCRICECRPPNSLGTFEPCDWAAKGGEKGPTINEFSPTHQRQSERSIVISKIFGLNPLFGRLRGLFYPLLTGSHTRIYVYTVYCIYCILYKHRVMGGVEIVHFWSITL